MTDPTNLMGTLHPSVLLSLPLLLSLGCYLAGFLISPDRRYSVPKPTDIEKPAQLRAPQRGRWRLSRGFMTAGEFFGISFLGGVAVILVVLVLAPLIWGGALLGEAVTKGASILLVSLGAAGFFLLLRR